MWQSQNGIGKTMGDGRRDPKKRIGKGSKELNPISNIPNKCGTKKKREDPKKKTSAKKQVSQKIFTSNYDNDSVKRTIRVLLSSSAVPQSVDMAGHV